MKTLLIILLSGMSIGLTYADKPTVKIYTITKMDRNSPNPSFPEVILEIANSTKKVIYISGSQISSPVYNLEAQREGKWLRVPRFICGTGHKIYPLKPGAKILVTPEIPFDEKVFRFRYFFQNDTEWNSSQVFSIVSRPIRKSELGDLFGTIGELNSDKELEPLDEDGTTTKPSGDPFGNN